MSRLRRAADLGATALFSAVGTWLGVFLVLWLLGWGGGVAVNISRDELGLLVVVKMNPREGEWP